MGGSKTDSKSATNIAALARMLGNVEGLRLQLQLSCMYEELDDKPQRTLLPRFSIRTLFWLVTASAVLFVVVGMAAREHDWAWGVSIGLASILFTAVVHGALFGVVWLFGQLGSARPKDMG
jgi:hypothetical protein